MTEDLETRLESRRIKSGDSVPSPEHIAYLRATWLRLGPGEEAAFEFELEGNATIFRHLTKEDIWLRYQDGLSRRAEALRAEEVAATNALAVTNTKLAERQFWLAIAITAATLVQAVAAVIALAGVTR
jgi:hypothetical protein